MSRGGDRRGEHVTRPGRSALLSVVLGAVLLSACRLQIDVNVTVAEDGSGRIEVVAGLDADAIDRIGGDLGAVLAVEDLVDAGWAVDGPTLEDDGYTRVRISRPFANPGEAAQIFSQIAGEDGPFQAFAVERKTSFATTTWDFSGTIDFAGGLEAFGDPRLAAELDGEPLGQSVDEIEAQLGEPLSELVDVRVRVRLPGEVTSNATEMSADGAVWQVAFGEEAVELDAHGEESRTSTLVAAALGIASAVILLLYVLIRLALRSRNRRRAAAPADANL